MGGGTSRGLLVATVAAVLLTAGVVWWHFAGSGGGAGGDWQATEDAERLRMELRQWIGHLERTPAAGRPEAIIARLDESVRPAERAVLVRQVAELLNRMSQASPAEVVRYQGGEIVRATWRRKDGGQAMLFFRCPEGNPTPRLLRAGM